LQLLEEGKCMGKGKHLQLQREVQMHERGLAPAVA
jgi:hypothetical protein